LFVVVCTCHQYISDEKYGTGVLAELEGGWCSPGSRLGDGPTVTDNDTV